MFLEYCNDGDLWQYLSHKQDRRLSELEAVLFIKHIIKAFKMLHHCKVIHRDIKPANILLHNGIAKVSDFGFARVIEQSMDGTNKYLKSRPREIFTCGLPSVHGSLDFGW